ncbi:exonuclease SbcCD subunit D [Neptunomonas qingdaonensis]|uniref:Nuclease SbcCD subunit D n=1 Tax=Neptunomonas qingdaonensis TaxID=1045558 RepID=A0A1I2TVG0_9GAMM|nr:exonuclease SbcCD subunit D [Neptunomonas qingdaonensis]SFG68209.1 Exodeoxyribonuclease I subunit D [Neptunomonas qingdaonensis]
MRFIHTSDWHIGRLFQNVSLLDDQLHVLKQIKNYAVQHNVDALVIAGDIFDRSVPPAEAVDALNVFLEDFTRDLSIPVIMISGNHDSAKRLRFGSQYMRQAGLHILGDIREVAQPVQVDTDSGPVHFFGLPYHDPVEVREAYGCEVKTYDEAHTHLAEIARQARTPGIPAVLISHCFIDGATESDSERPLSIGGADRVSYQPLTSFDYVALGHLHGPQYKGEEHIRYSGSLLKYSFSEHQQNKGVCLVELNDKGFVSQQHLKLTPKHNLRVIEGELEDLIQQAKSDSATEDYILARLTDKHDLLDPLGRLRLVYPNTLQMELTQFSISSGSKLVANVDNERSEDQVFADFFTQVMDTELTDAQTVLLHGVIMEARTAMEGKE